MKSNALEPPRAEASVGDWRIARWLPFALPLLLTGCPLSDKYYVDDLGSAGSSGAGQASSGGTSSANGGAPSGGAASGGAPNFVNGGSAEAGAVGEGCDDLCPAGRTCENGSCSGGWVSMAAPPAKFEARQRAASVAFNGKLFVFGGVNDNGDELNSAAIYDPMSDSWTLAAIDGSTPSVRQWATALALSDRILVTGGRSDTTSTYLKSGALYDPASDRWQSMANAITARAASYGGVAGNYAVIAGGLTTGGGAATGADVYDIQQDKWRTAATMGAPPGVLGGGWAFNDGYMFLFGGLSNNMRLDHGFRYDVARDLWSPLPPAGGPSARSGAFAAFDGTNFLVWGGRDEAALHDDGALFSTMWSALSTSAAPSARTVMPRQAGWAFALGDNDFAVLGGEAQDGSVLMDGGRLQSNRWQAIPSWPSGESHSGAAVALVGREIVVWGGLDGNGVTTTGERWLAH